MKFLRCLSPIITVVSLAIASCVNGAEHDAEFHFSTHDKELNERDFQALKDYLNTKRTIDVKEKSTNLTISGDVRTEWRHLYEKKFGHNQVGGHATDCAGRPRSRNDFDIEFNLRFDYVCERAWAIAHLQYDNSAGIDNDVDCCCNTVSCTDEPCGCTVGSKRILRRGRFHGSGQCDDLCLKRAYMGYNVIADCGRFDVELGRRLLYDVFESEIQFLSRFDGLLLTYSNTWECVSDWYVKWGGFVVDERVNHFAWATEFALINLCDSGFDFKYSFIDWIKRGTDRCYVRNPRAFKYCNSQVILTYHLEPDLLCVPVEFYGAFLINHCAKQVNKKKHKGLAWYVGVTTGSVVKEGDWSVDVEYQWVQEDAIAWDDQSGIGLLDARADCCGVNPTPGYKGWRVEGLYALTDNLTLSSIIEWARSNQAHRHTYSKFELEAIYAF